MTYTFSKNGNISHFIHILLKKSSLFYLKYLLKLGGIFYVKKYFIYIKDQREKSSCKIKSNVVWYVYRSRTIRKRTV